MANENRRGEIDEIDLTVTNRRTLSKKRKRSKERRVHIRASVPKCPLCEYYSESGKHTARHFQQVHFAQCLQVITGKAVYHGISKKEISDQDMTKLVSTLTKKTADAAAKAQARRFQDKKYKPVPPILIRATVSQCPLCKYYSDFGKHTARHFQSIHKVEFQQIIEGSSIYPGITKRELRDSNGINRNTCSLMPVLVKEESEGVDVEANESEGSTSILDLDMDLNPPTLTPAQQTEIENQNTRHCSVQTENYDLNSEVENSKQQFNSSIPLKQLDGSDLASGGKNTISFINMAPLVTLRCPVPDCNFQTTSQFSLLVHNKFHEVLECVPPLLKATIKAVPNM